MGQQRTIFLLLSVVFCTVRVSHAFVAPVNGAFAPVSLGPTSGGRAPPSLQALKPSPYSIVEKKPPAKPSARRHLRQASLVFWSLWSVFLATRPPVHAAAATQSLQTSNVLAAFSLLVGTAGLGLTLSGVPRLALAIGKASIRSTLQLCFVGSLLNQFFALSNVWLVLGWIVSTACFAAQEASSRVDYSYDKLYRHLVASLLMGGGTVLGLSSLLRVFGKVTPWYDPRIWIPTTGMVFGNSLTTTSLAAQSLTNTLQTQSDSIELRLSQGATIQEALRDKLHKIFQTSLTPVLNFLAVAGIVHIPGMMTGQILAGRNPLQAASYQLLIFFLIASTSVLTVQLLIRLGVRELSDRAHQRLRSNTLYKVDRSSKQKRKGTLGFLVSLMNPLRRKNQTQDSRLVNGTSTSCQEPVQIVELQRNDLTNDKVVTLSVDKMHVGRTNIDLSMQVCYDDRIAVTGRSGAGKSLLLRTLVGLEEGRLNATLLDVPVSQMSMAEWRSHLVLVPQERPALEGTPNEFYEEVSRFATQKAKLANVIAGHQRTPVQYASDWGLRADKLDQPWTTLSGGESQRAMLAIALSLQPDVLLLDESMNALDNHTLLKVETTLKSMRIPIVMVSHSPAQMERFCTHQIELDSPLIPSTLSPTSKGDKTVV